jgi:hypothetical protein
MRGKSGKKNRGNQAKGSNLGINRQVLSTHSTDCTHARPVNTLYTNRSCQETVQHTDTDPVNCLYSTTHCIQWYCQYTVHHTVHLDTVYTHSTTQNTVHTDTVNTQFRILCNNRSCQLTVQHTVHTDPFNTRYSTLYTQILSTYSTAHCAQTDPVKHKVQSTVRWHSCLHTVQHTFFFLNRSRQHTAQHTARWQILLMHSTADCTQKYVFVFTSSLLR